MKHDRIQADIWAKEDRADAAARQRLDRAMMLLSIAIVLYWGGQIIRWAVSA
ncbi:hypothetical protein [Sphingobium boeckii]|uniref:Uncharacterized protein n=1 Tax=Sphingobium boeckii TaxID=1082345 RepID=A0A7W9AEQ1_9SPHN|nr:hypothetical protein [Sphingobium boeckii]MBB5684325.1 hypothetical protein [Sphingobium boeckii]